MPSRGLAKPFIQILSKALMSLSLFSPLLHVRATILISDFENGEIRIQLNRRISRYETFSPLISLIRNCRGDEDAETKVAKRAPLLISQSARLVHPMELNARSSE